MNYHAYASRMFRDQALHSLQWHWGEAYEISEACGVWRAVRLDNQRALVATDPRDLRNLIVVDYAGQPVARWKAAGAP